MLERIPSHCVPACVAIVHVLVVEPAVVGEHRAAVEVLDSHTELGRQQLARMLQQVTRTDRARIKRALLDHRTVALRTSDCLPFDTLEAACRALPFLIKGVLSYLFWKLSNYRDHLFGSGSQFLDRFHVHLGSPCGTQ